MRPGGVAARTLEPDRHSVGRGGDGTLTDPDLADREGRVAVEGEDGVDAGHLARLDQHAGPAGNRLLGRLEHQPHSSTGEVGL